MSFVAFVACFRSRRLGRLVCGAALLAVVSPVVAQPAAPPPEGFPAGRWVLAPYLWSQYEANDNVFSRSKTNDLPVESDQISTLTVGMVANLPFRNSMLELSYEANQFSYDKQSLSRDLDQEGQVEFEFNFGSRDRLIVRENYTLGSIDLLRVDVGQELTFEGNPYNRNQVDLEWSRSVPRRAGYQIRVSRIDLKFDEEQESSFFDYRGWDTLAEYRQPLSGYRWFTFRYSLRRFDHFQSTAQPFPTGVPTRTETSDRYEIGLRGVLGRDKPYAVRLGYGRFSYRDAVNPQNVNEPLDSSDFAGFVGSAIWRIRAGGRSLVDLQVNRRALPSTFDTYYINNEIRTRFEREWIQDSKVGASILVSENRYGDPVACEGAIAEGDPDRTDRSQSAEIFMEWAMDKRVGFRLSAAHLRRSSTCRLSEYEVNRVSAGVSFGWF